MYLRNLVLAFLSLCPLSVAVAEEGKRKHFSPTREATLKIEAARKRVLENDTLSKQTLALQSSESILSNPDLTDAQKLQELAKLVNDYADHSARLLKTIEERSAEAPFIYEETPEYLTRLYDAKLIALLVERGQGDKLAKLILQMHERASPLPPNLQLEVRLSGVSTLDKLPIERRQVSEIRADF
jgi:hypothetical protein